MNLPVLRRLGHLVLGLSRLDSALPKHAKKGYFSTKKEEIQGQEASKCGHEQMEKKKVPGPGTCIN